MHINNQMPYLTIHLGVFVDICTNNLCHRGTITARRKMLFYVCPSDSICLHWSELEEVYLQLCFENDHKN